MTIGDTSYALPDPFVVIATQNPIEHEGTYALPEAQVDRFVMKLRVDYPTRGRRAAHARAVSRSDDGSGGGAARADARRDPRDRAPRRARAHGRAHRPLHRAARDRHAQAGRLPPAVAGAPHRLRRLAARDARPRARGQGARVPRRPRVRRARGREGRRARRAAAPAGAQLRGGGRADDCATGSSIRSWERWRCRSPECSSRRVS